MCKVILVGLVLVLACCVDDARAQTAYPMVMSISPVAAQAGTTTRHTIRSRYNLDDAYQVWIAGEGVQGVKADGKPASAENVEIEVTVAANAAPGVRDVRVATPRGVSTVGQLVITNDPIFREADRNDKREEAQLVTLPATLCGCIEKNEDVDWFRFSVDAGAELCFQCAACDWKIVSTICKHMLIPS